MLHLYPPLQKLENKHQTVDGPPTNMSKIIFLDVDGILNLEGDQPPTLKPTLLKALGTLVQNTQASLVLSSTWRHHPQLCQILTSALMEVSQLPSNAILSMTGDARPGNLGRAEEIGEWLNATMLSETSLPIVNWLVLDTLPLGGVPYFANHYIHVDATVGLSQRDVKLATQMLNAKRKKNKNKNKGAARDSTTNSTKQGKEDVAMLMEQYQAHQRQVARDQLHAKITALSARKEQVMDEVSEGKLPWFDTGSGGAILKLSMASHVHLLDQNIRTLKEHLQEISTN